MSLISLDFPSGSTGLYGTDKAKMLDGLYAQIGNTLLGDSGNIALVEDPDPNITGNVLRCNANSYGGAGNRVTAREVVPNGETTTVNIFGRMWMSRLPQATDEIPLPAVWKDGGNNTIVELRVTTTGAIEAYSGGGSLLGATAGPVLTAAGWHHYEGSLTCSIVGAGELTVWVEGREVLSLTGLTTSDAGTSQIERGVNPSNTSSNPAVYFKETGMSDSSGTENNGQIGPLLVVDLTVDEDVSSGWTSTAATNYEVLDESDPDDEDYIEADDTLPAASVMTLTDLPDDIVAVRGLVTFYRGWKVDSGDGKIQPGLTPNGTDWDDGADQALTTAALYYRGVSEVSPDTATAWTPTEVNAAYLRLNRTL